MTLSRVYMAFAAMPASAYAATSADEWNIRLGLVLIAILIAAVAIFLMFQHRKIRQHQDRLTRALLASDTGVWFWSQQQDRYYFSPEFFQRFGYLRSDLPDTESSWLNFIHPEDAPRYVEHSFSQRGAQTSDDMRVFDIRLRIADREGFLHWVRMHGQVTRWDQRGRPIAAAGRIENIDQVIESERALNQVRQRLQERTQLLSALLNNIPDLIWFKDEQGRYVDCNHHYAEFVGIPKRPLLGKTDLELQLDHASVEDESQDMEVLRSNQAVIEEKWVQPLNTDEMRLYELRKIPVKHRTQPIHGLLGIARDITERQQLLNELQRFKRFADNSSQGFGMARMSGEIVYMNSRLCQLLDIEEESYPEQPFDRFYPPEIQERIVHEIVPHAILHGHWEGELEACTSTGERFPTRESFFIIRDEHGKPRYLGDVMTDISEQKRAAQQLAEARDQAEQANQTKSAFLANMSHEIRTPLNAILGYAQLLSADQNITGRTHERILAIMNAGERLLGLINDILDIAKIEAGRLVLNNQISNLHYEFSTICQLMQQRIISKGLKFEIDNQLSPDELVSVDALKLGQIVMNLLGNATKFTERGSITFNAHREGQWVHLLIKDTGSGISDTEQALLFTPFSQGSHRAGGTGLGLVLSQRLVHLMGGTIELHSQLGVGTTLSLSLPLPIEQVSESQHMVSGQYQHIQVCSPLHILIAEDDEWSRDVLHSLLLEMGINVTVTVNGQEALEACQQQTFDLILTDVLMPILDGIGLLHALKDMPQVAQTPIVAITASTLDHQRQELIEQGFRRVIGKPYRMQEIHACIQDFCQVDFEVLDNPFAESESAQQAIAVEPLTDDALLETMQQLADFAMFGDLAGIMNVLETVKQQLPTPLLNVFKQAIEQMDLGVIEQVARDHGAK